MPYPYGPLSATLTVNAYSLRHHHHNSIDSRGAATATAASTGSFLSPRFGHVVHVVRAPLQQIASFTAHSNKTYNFVLAAMRTVLLQQQLLQLTTDNAAAKEATAAAATIAQFEQVRV